MLLGDVGAVQKSNICSLLDQGSRSSISVSALKRALYRLPRGSDEHPMHQVRGQGAGLEGRDAPSTALPLALVASRSYCCSPHKQFRQTRISSFHGEHLGAAVPRIGPAEQPRQPAANGTKLDPMEWGESKLEEGQHRVLPPLGSPAAQGLCQERGNGQHLPPLSFPSGERVAGVMTVVVPSPVAHIGTTHAHRLWYSNSPIQQRASPLSPLRKRRKRELAPWQASSTDGSPANATVAHDARLKQFQAPTTVAASALAAATTACVPSFQVTRERNTCLRDAQRTSSGALFAYRFHENKVTHLDRRLQELPSVTDVRALRARTFFDPRSSNG